MHVYALKFSTECEKKKSKNAVQFNSCKLNVTSEYYIFQGMHTQ